MKVLITGGCGFIGGHLCELLVKKGHTVVALDDLSTGSMRNVESLKANKRFAFVKGNICNARVVDRLVRECDIVFHLASVVGVKLVCDEPVRTIETMADGTSIVIKACRKYMKKVLVASTSEVYGKGVKVPFSEDDDRLMGATSIRRWAYANCKAMDEFLALAHYYEAKLPVVVVRFFNTVGPRQTGMYGMVVPRFVKAALNNEPITVYDDGKQSRCFCHVLDVVEAIEKLMFHCPEAVGQVINVGNPKEVTIGDLAKFVKRQLKSKSEIRNISFEEAYPGGGFEDMRRRVPSIKKIKKLIGFKPTRTLKDIVRDVAESIKNESK
jgi:UDP-glucose 4-epimerase